MTELVSDSMQTFSEVADEMVKTWFADSNGGYYLSTSAEILPQTLARFASVRLILPTLLTILQ